MGFPAMAADLNFMEYKFVKPQKTQLKIVDIENEDGYIEGYASVFGNVDYDGEVIEKGAFTKTLLEGLPGRRIKLVDFHNAWLDSDYIIGVVEEANEDEHGLWFKARFSSVRRAQDVRTKIKEGILEALSIGYEVVKDRFDREAGIRYLTELKLFEISVVSWGANPLATINNGKSFNSQLRRLAWSALRMKNLNQVLKEGQVLSQNNAKLIREAIADLQALLAVTEPEEPTQVNQEPPTKEPDKKDQNQQDTAKELLSGIEQMARLFNAFNLELKDLESK